MKCIKYLIIVFVYSNILVSQTNLIPNGNFESCSSSSGCNNCNYNSGGIGGAASNWQNAPHYNDKGIYAPKIVDLNSSNCQSTLVDASYCNLYQPNPYVNPTSTSKRFIRLRADYDSKCKAKKQWHDAVGVQLPSNTNFGSGITYIIRYKINPLRATILDPNLFNQNDVNTCNTGGGDPFFTHIRFFLSNQSPSLWNKSSNASTQELINANFTKQLSPINSTDVDCNWIQCERKFIPSQNNKTTLIIYAENGGAFIDDVEVFEECESYKHIQNKYYDNFIFAPSAIDGLYNMNEKAGINLYVGKMINGGWPFGDVILANGSKVNFTAANVITITDGFWVQPGADFTAKILPCPNNFNRLINPNTNPDPNYIIPAPLIADEDIVPDDEQINEIFNISIFPNPNNGQFNIQLSEDEELPTSISIQNILGQVVLTRDVTSNNTQVDLNEAPKGIYMLLINYKQYTITKKIIKQ